MFVGQGSPETNTRLQSLKISTLQAPIDACTSGDRNGRGQLLNTLASFHFFRTLVLASCIATVSFPTANAQAPSLPQSVNPEKTTSDGLNVELRIVWGATKPRAFRGTIAVNYGTLNVVRNLSQQSDSIGSVSNVGPATINIAPHSLSLFGGADLAIQGNSSTSITLRIDDGLSNKPTEYVVQLVDVLSGTWIRELDDQGARVAIERQLHDRIRVQSQQSTNILPVSSPWTATVSGYRCGLAEGDYYLSTSLIDEDSGAVISKLEDRPVAIDAYGSFPANSVEFSLPSVEGAYAVEFALLRKRFLQSFVSTPVAVTRRLDLVTFDAKAPVTQIDQWAPVATIQPLNSQWWTPLNWLTTVGTGQVLTPFTGIAETKKRPVGYGAQNRRASSGVDCLTLSPSAWQAYPLKITQVGKAHRLRIRVPNDQPQQLIVSIRDSHPNGEPTTLNIDSGMTLTERQIASEFSASPGFIEHEVVFWPRSEQPFVLLMNGSALHDAAFGDIQLEAAQLTATTAAPLSSASLAAHSADSQAKNTLGNQPEIDQPAGGDFDRGAEQRASVLYLNKPLLADAFGAGRSIDPLTQRPLESWHTWNQVAVRVTQYMISKGYNTLVLNGMCDGGAVFPSKQPSTRRFDNGTFFSDGRSTEMKDLVELLSLHFDRAGLRLVLGLEISGQLPGLARAENDVTKQAGLYQVNLDGTLWKSETEANSRRVLYNPLNPLVQAEIENLIREVSARYAVHDSFGGIAIELAEHSHLMFAGDRWGYDDATLRKFEAATQSKLPPRETLPDAMKGAMRLSFLNWRANELSTYFVRLSEAIKQSQPRAKLLVNPLLIWDKRPSERDYVDPKMQSRNLIDYLLAAGIDGNRLRQSPNIVLLRGRIESPLKTGLAQDWHSRLANDSGLLNADVGNQDGALVIQRPFGVPIREANKLQNATVQTTAWTYPQLTPLGSGTVQSLVAMLHREDALLLGDGGLMPIQGDSPKMMQIRKSFLEFPNVPMRTFNINSGESSVRVRTATVGTDTYLQLVNAAPWTERITMDVRIAGAQGLVEILGGRELQLNGNAAQLAASSRNGAQRMQRNTVWQFEIPPHDLIGIRVIDPQFQVNNVMHSPDPAIVTRMTAEIEHLESLMARASDPGRSNALGIQGGDFEEWTDESRPAGWTVSSLPQVSIARETALPRSGQNCVMLENRNNAQVAAWIQSDKIRIPNSGRLAVEAWVRSSPSATTPMALQLSVIGRTRDGRRFQRGYHFGSALPGSEVMVDWGRKPIVLYVSDLPSDELVELYVAFDLIGPGKIWVDDIQAYEPLINPDERVQIRGQLFLAREKLRDSNPYPAEQVLNSHWARYLLTLDDQLRQEISPVASPASTSAAPGEPALQSNSRWSSPVPFLQQWRDSMRERWQR